MIKIEMYYLADGETETKITTGTVETVIKQTEDRLTARGLYNGWDYVNETLNVYNNRDDDTPEIAIAFQEI